MATATIYAQHSSTISKNEPTVNTPDTTLVVYKGYSGNYIKNSIISFDISAYSADTITSVKLYLRSVEIVAGAVGKVINVNKMRRTDWVYNQATWNIYKTGSNWGTAGAINTTSDIDTAGEVNYTIPNQTLGYVEFDISTIATDAVANMNGIVRLNINARTNTGSAGQDVVFYGKDNPTTHAPYLEITYTPARPIAIDEYPRTANTKLLLHLNGSSADSSGLANNGVATAVTYGVGKFQQCAIFNGTTSSIYCGASNLSLPTTGWTMSVWFKTTQNSGYPTILEYYGGSTICSILLYGIEGKIFGHILDSNGTDVGQAWSSNSSLNDNNWHHACLVFLGSGTPAKLYIDGIFAGYGNGATFTGNFNNLTANLGSQNALFNGSIDEVIVEDRVWTESEVVFYYSKKSATKIVPLSGTRFINDSNLVSYWKFDGNSNDSKGSNNGTDTGITYQTGKFGQGAELTTTGDKIVIANETNFDFERTQPFTISAWIKLGDLTLDRMIVVKQVQGGNYNGYGLWYSNNGKVVWSLVNTPTNMFEIVSPLNISSQEWVFIVGTYDGSSNISGLKLYINGILANTTIGANSLTGSILNNTNVEIGNRSGVFNFDGTIDDVAIFNRELSAIEVAELYPAHTLGEYTQTSDTKLLLHMNGSSFDSSVGQNKKVDTDIYYSPKNGRLGQGADFNGSSSSINITDTTPLQLVGNYTISFWLNRNVSSSTQRIINKDNCNDFSGGYSIYLDNNYLCWSHNSNLGNTNWDNIFIVPTSTWNLITCVYDGSNRIIYLNGVKISNLATTVNVIGETTNNLIIGAYGNTIPLGQYYSGALDEVIIESVAWSASKVAKYYSQAKGRFGNI